MMDNKIGNERYYWILRTITKKYPACLYMMFRQLIVRLIIIMIIFFII